MDRVTSRLASVIVNVVEFRRVWDRIKPIIRNKTDKCSERSPKIGPLTDLHTRWHSSYFSSKKRRSYKKLPFVLDNMSRRFCLYANEFAGNQSRDNLLVKACALKTRGRFDDEGKTKARTIPVFSWKEGRVITLLSWWYWIASLVKQNGEF